MGLRSTGVAPVPPEEAASCDTRGVRLYTPLHHLLVMPRMQTAAVEGAAAESVGAEMMQSNMRLSMMRRCESVESFLAKVL